MLYYFYTLQLRSNKVGYNVLKSSCLGCLDYFIMELHGRDEHFIAFKVGKENVLHSRQLLGTLYDGYNQSINNVLQIRKLWLKKEACGLHF